MASQQSWTSWILDAYAGAVSSGPSQDDEKTTNTTTADQQTSTDTSSSPYGPYLRTGRGGAGNFTWQSSTPSAPQQQQHQDDPNSLEAQNPSTLSERRKAAATIEHVDTNTALQAKAAQRPASQYIRVGRGFIQSNEIQQSSSPRSPVVVPMPTNTAVAHPGRGGAGNHAAAAEAIARAQDEKKAKEQIDAVQRREKIEELVQNELPAPPDAWLGGRRRSVEAPEGHV